LRRVQLARSCAMEEEDVVKEVKGVVSRAGSVGGRTIATICRFLVSSISAVCIYIVYWNSYAVFHVYVYDIVWCLLFVWCWWAETFITEC